MKAIHARGPFSISDRSHQMHTCSVAAFLFQPKVHDSRKMVSRLNQKPQIKCKTCKMPKPSLEFCMSKKTRLRGIRMSIAASFQEKLTSNQRQVRTQPGLPYLGGVGLLNAYHTRVYSPLLYRGIHSHYSVVRKSRQILRLQKTCYLLVFYVLAEALEERRCLSTGSICLGSKVYTVTLQYRRFRGQYGSQR